MAGVELERTAAHIEHIVGVGEDDKFKIRRWQ
jgi:hypothetical protein